MQMDRGCGGRRPLRLLARPASTRSGVLANDQRPTTKDCVSTTNDYNLLMMDEQVFRKRADAALDSLKKSLMEAEDSADIEVEDQSGALHISFEDHSKFVISPNAPVRQIWISALATSFKLDWSDAEQDFVLSKTGERLKALVARLINQQLGEELVTLA
jgi:iron donor protein CyaY